jgi:hypothetical protein
MTTPQEWAGGIAAVIAGQLFWFLYHTYTRKQNPYVPPPDDDQDVIRNLRRRMEKAGIRGDALIRVAHYLMFPSEQQAVAAMDVLTQHGFEAQGGEYNTSAKYRFVVLAKRTVTAEGVPDDVKRLTAFAKEAGGEYDLWTPEL